MITGELKSKMDRVWDALWTSGITSPSTTIEQITYIVFMKLLDDDELRREANASALKAPYKSRLFPNGMYTPENSTKSVKFSDLRWNNFKNLEPTQMYDLVMYFVFPFIKTANGSGKDTAFSKYMSDAVFLVPTPKVLALIVSELNNIDMTNKDIMGDVYEYCLGKMASAGTLGQFRTPRHIIDMMVELVEPKVDDTVLDPAMGTAGFLLGTARYVTEHYKKELLNKKNQEHYNSEMFHGYDTDPSMLRIGAMNMLLHGVEEPDINRKDSLSDDNPTRNYYSLIMANPPFKGSVFPEDISKDVLSLCNTKKTELLFLSLFIQSLRVGGRCACIVPDGVLFGSSKAHKDIRKELITNNKLLAVISMPSGVFKPYAGVSTAILIFTKDPAGTDKVWFYDMTADGFSLDDKRSSVNENDIPDIIERYKNMDKEQERERTDKSFVVPAQEIVDNEYDLSINKYKKTEYVPVEYPPTNEILDELDRLEAQISQEMKELRKMLNDD